MVTRQQALNAGRDFHSLLHLFVDEIPNDQQVQEMLTAGFAAANAVRNTLIPAKERKAVWTNILEGMLTELNTVDPEFMLPLTATP